MVERLQAMMSCYQRDQFVNPELALLQYATYVEQFEDEVIESLTSPRSGLQTQCKFPPSLAEVRAFCERSKRSFDAINNKKWREENPPKPAPPEANRNNRETREELLARHPWLGREKQPPPTRDGAFRRLSAIAAEWGVTVTKDQLDAIPDASPTRKTG